jgi:hypothetical protein
VSQDPRKGERRQNPVRANRNCKKNNPFQNIFLISGGYCASEVRKPILFSRALAEGCCLRRK